MTLATPPGIHRPSVRWNGPPAVYGLPMVDVATHRPVGEVLELALDLCLGAAAFRVTRTGSVDVVLADPGATEDALERIRALARSCLAHPGAGRRPFFWNAEVSTEADAADRSLACVAVPVWNDHGPNGVLGVVDTWLPEPDDAQRGALLRLAAELALDGLTDESHVDAGVRTWTEDLVVAGSPAPPGTPTGTSAAERRFLGEVLRSLPDAVVITKGDGTILLANDAFARMVGCGPERLTGGNVRTMMTATGTGRGLGASSGRPEDQPSRRRLTVSGPDGLMPVTSTDVRVGGNGGRAAGGGHDGDDDFYVSVLRPAPSPEGCAATEAVDCLDLVGSLDDGILCLDGTGTVVLANRAAEILHGAAARRTLVGLPLPDPSGLRTGDGQALPWDAHPGLIAIRDGTCTTQQLVLGGEGDSQRHVTVTARPFPVDGARGALVVLHDSTRERLEQQRLTQYALYDPLTGLANRYLLLEELRRMLLLLGRQGGAVALVYLDLDGFKAINDEFGHDTGDEVLAAVARRLRGTVRSDDVVARLGGDEFVIAHASTERLPDGDLVVSRLRKVLSAPFRVRSQAFDVGASIGWVSTDKGEEGPEALLAKADRAMYLQKRNRASARRAPA